jgi:arylsulfatase A-like enzyme/Flp pilus assembly protein TadD
LYLERTCSLQICSIDQKLLWLVAFSLVVLSACTADTPKGVERPREEHPSILLVTLDTTRADHLGFESKEVQTPHLDKLAARGVRFSQAYTTAPMTLPAHASMLTGLYPAEHGIHENSRAFPKHQTLLASFLVEKGYSTAAFVSGYPLSRQFGLARGFEHFDDSFGSSSAERRAKETTNLALGYLEQSAGPLFLWVHYFDPHEPYDPPEPFKSTYESNPYRGEIAAMDQEFGRLLEAFEQRFQNTRVLVVGDHGESLGEHGEALHGNLLYQGVMRVPLMIAGRGIAPGQIAEPVSTRRVFDTVLAWAGIPRPHHLLSGEQEVVLAEAMKPFLQYGWQPQVMAVRGAVKVIRAGDLEVYDLDGDPGETHNLEGSWEPDRDLLEELRAYPFLPAAIQANSAGLSREGEERLASLGYVGWQGQTTLREDAPNPREMTHLFADLDRGSGLFVRQRYQRAVSVLEEVLEEDPKNLMVHVRLAVAHSLLNHEERALEFFEQARQIDPGSVDIRHYLAMHYFRQGRWAAAAPLFESVLAQMPQRIPALQNLARIRSEEGRLEDAVLLLERTLDLTPTDTERMVELGRIRMALGATQDAILAFEQAHGFQGGEFPAFLELGVCYLANQQLREARDSLDRVPSDHPEYPMALFKRAQVSVLLNEGDREERIRLAYDKADPTIRRLIENERLFAVP